MNVITFVALAVGVATGDYVSAHEGSFWLHEHVFHFVGVNLRSISFYGYNDALPKAQFSDVNINLKGLQAMGGRVLRMFVSWHKIDTDETATRLGSVLDTLAIYNIRAIVCFTDSYTSGWSPKGDEKFYIKQANGWTILDDSWFAGGYKENYLPHVLQIVEQFAQHPSVFAWEVGNELQDQKNPANMHPFVAAVAAAIKHVDPNHMVTTGFISVDHTLQGYTSGLALYSDPNIDFITYHTYNNQNNDTINRAIYCALDKPMIVEEFGFQSKYGDRVKSTETNLERWYDGAAVRGYMQWAFQYQDADIGDSDFNVGMDRYEFKDFDQLFGLYSARAAKLANSTSDPDHKLSSYCKTQPIFS